MHINSFYHSYSTHIDCIILPINYFTIHLYSLKKKITEISSSNVYNEWYLLPYFLIFMLRDVLEYISRLISFDILNYMIDKKINNLTTKKKLLLRYYPAVNGVELKNNKQMVHLSLSSKALTHNIIFLKKIIWWGLFFHFLHWECFAF